MAYDYNALYATTPNALGEPTKIITDFFSRFADNKLRVLDIGAGQGRDALFLGRAGHNVVAIDFAPSGIDQLNTTAKAENLPIKGIVADITEYSTDQSFDVVLIDRTLHMLPEKSRLAVLDNLLTTVAPSGWCVIADEKSNIANYKATASAHHYEFHIDHDKAGHLHLQRIDNRNQ